MSSSVSRFRKSGKYRSLEIDRKLHKHNTKVVVLANGFIENGYWYLLENISENMSDMFFQAGYDVHIMTFRPNKILLNRRFDTLTDASFKEIVCNQIPYYLDQIKKNYKEIHLIGHSYGATLLTSWLAGYTLSGQSRSVSPNPLLAQKNQLGITSFISLSGFYGVNWDFFENNFFPRLAKEIPKKLDKEFSSEYSTLTLYAITKFASKSSYIHTGSLSLLKPLVNKNIGQIFKFLPTHLLPFVHLKNANPAALAEALVYGSHHESWDTFDSMLSMTRKNYNDFWKSKLFETFYESLSYIKTPSIFIQGSKDLMSPPSMIRTFGFDLMGSLTKEFFTIPDTGHQDLLIPKNPAPLYSKLCDWVNAS